VSNFCNDIIYDRISNINDVNLELLYVDEVIKAILNFKPKEKFKTQNVNLPELYKRIKNLHQLYIEKDKIVLNDDLDIQLFTTLKSYIK
jgi:hypothetical protein